MPVDATSILKVNTEFSSARSLGRGFRVTVNMHTLVSGARRRACHVDPGHPGTMDASIDIPPFILLDPGE